MFLLAINIIGLGQSSNSFKLWRAVEASILNQPCEKITDLMNVNICTRSEILFIMHRIARSRDILPILQWSVEFSWPPNRGGLAVPVMQPPWPKLQALLATGNHASFNSTSFSDFFHHFCTKSSQPPRHGLVMSLRFKSGMICRQRDTNMIRRFSWPFASNTTKNTEPICHQTKSSDPSKQFKGEKK